MPRRIVLTLALLTVAGTATAFVSAGGSGFAWHDTPTGSAARLRGVAAISADVAWTSGSLGTVLRTVNGGKLAAATLHHVVAFQVDEVDPVARTGWSVLGVGEAYEVTDARRLADLADRMPAPWVADRSAHTVAIPLQRLTGRVLGP